MNTLTIISRLPSENIREYAYRMLRYNIMNLQLPPGATINESELCQLLNCSRTPVHEALALLKSEGLVNIVPQSGSNITLINMKNVREGLFFRNSVEPALVRQLAGNITRDTLNSMKQNLTQMEALLQPQVFDSVSLNTFMNLDDEFHKITYFACQKDTIWKAVHSVCSHYDRIRYQGSIEQLDDLKVVCEEHRRVYDFLLLGGDPQFDLEAFYYKHLSHFKNYYSALYKMHPEYFTMG